MNRTVLEQTILMNLFGQTKNMHSLMESIDDELKKEFYPAISKLILEKKLCYSWVKGGSGFPEKYLVITNRGIQCLKSPDN